MHCPNNPLPGQMRGAAAALLGLLTEEQRTHAALPFGADTARRWLEYRPEAGPAPAWRPSASRPARPPTACSPPA
jgi:hypothetical protein